MWFPPPLPIPSRLYLSFGENAMDVHFVGGCLCGEIRYECLSAPVFTYICHCSDCQKAHGSAFCPGLMFPQDSVRIVRGTPKDYTVSADSGMSITRQFCPTCGSALFTHLEKFPNSIITKAGTLDDPNLFKPRIHVWAKSEWSWAKIDDGLERYPEGLPPEK